MHIKKIYFSIGEEGEDETTVASGSIFDPSTTSLVDVTCPPHLSSMAEEEVGAAVCSQHGGPLNVNFLYLFFCIFFQLFVCLLIDLLIYLEFLWVCPCCQCCQRDYLSVIDFFFLPISFSISQKAMKSISSAGCSLGRSFRWHCRVHTRLVAFLFVLFFRFMATVLHTHTRLYIGTKVDMHTYVHTLINSHTCICTDRCAANPVLLDANLVVCFRQNEYWSRQVMYW